MLAGKAPRTAVAACANGRRRWLGVSARSGETFSLWTWRTSCERFLLRLYGSTALAAVARLQHARARRVGAGAVSLVAGLPRARNCPSLCSPGP